MAKKSLPQRGDSRKRVEDMNLAEIVAYNKELLAKLKRLLAERRIELEQADPVPQPVPVKVKAAKLPTRRMTKAVAAFDGMTDSEQMDSLRAMW
jgi:hypothetical protein